MDISHASNQVTYIAENLFSNILTTNGVKLCFQLEECNKNNTRYLILN